jgi:hypothetical protein
MSGWRVRQYDDGGACAPSDVVVAGVKFKEDLHEELATGSILLATDVIQRNCLREPVSDLQCASQKRTAHPWAEKSSLAC